MELKEIEKKVEDIVPKECKLTKVDAEGLDVVLYLGDIKAFYAKSKQPTVKYGKGIHKLDADEAIDKFTPSTIIGAFITHKYNKEHCLTEGNMYGVAEEKIIEKGIKYIFIGNKSTHQKKYICKKYPNFKTYQFDWLFAKVKNQQDNVIWIWN